MKSPQPRVLVVNSTPEMSSIIANVLSTEGFSVVVAEGRQSPSFKIATGDFSIIVLEKGPHAARDSSDIVRQARTHHPRLKALYLYLSNRPDRVENNCDLDSCLVAPFSLRELIGCMGNVSV